METKLTLEPYSQEWERLAGQIARNFAPDIYPCKKCSHPVVSGYRCTFCGDSNPTETFEQEAAYNKKYGIGN